MLWRGKYEWECQRFTYLCVSTHDLTGLLVNRFTVPIPVESLQLTSQAVMLTQEQCMNGGQGDVLIHTAITLKTEMQLR